MGYLLIDATIAQEKGLKHFEKMPDGRAIMDIGMIRVLGSMADVEIVANIKELKAKIKEQKDSGLYGVNVEVEEPATEPTEMTDTTETAEEDVSEEVVEGNTEEEQFIEEEVTHE